MVVVLVPLFWLPLELEQTLFTHPLAPTLDEHFSNLSLALLCGGIFWGTLWSLGQWRIADQTGLQPQPLHDGAIWVKANLSEDVVIGSWNAGTLVIYRNDRSLI